MEAPIKIKRTAITLAQKVQIILKLNDPSFKQKEIAQEYGLTASAISKIAKKKEGILEEWLRGGNLERKRKREGKNQTIDDALLSWFWMASKEEGPISGPVLMAKAKALAEEMGIEFKPTNGWLCRWKNRNNLAYRRVPREKAEYRAKSGQRTGLPILITPSLCSQDRQPAPEYYGEGTPTQALEEAEEDSHDQTAERIEQEEQDAHFYTGKSCTSKQGWMETAHNGNKLLCIRMGFIPKISNRKSAFWKEEHHSPHSPLFSRIQLKAMEEDLPLMGVVNVQHGTTLYTRRPVFNVSQDGPIFNH
ncbi:major centromere autoantigen B [Narcine bancroftii]|uniref:major centromere autoantigen B n=1 Tax=Narcine bancroftii TaxID=1343680 RepID=UPI003831AEBB